MHPAWPGWPVEADYLAARRRPGIDLVVIATPNDSHHPVAHAALLAGKAVVIDKPFTVTLTEAQDLVDLARERGQCCRFPQPALGWRFSERGTAHPQRRARRGARVRVALRPLRPDAT